MSNMFISISRHSWKNIFKDISIPIFFLRCSKDSSGKGEAQPLSLAEWNCAQHKKISGRKSVDLDGANTTLQHF